MEAATLVHRHYQTRALDLQQLLELQQQVRQLEYALNRHLHLIHRQDGLTLEQQPEQVQEQELQQLEPPSMLGLQRMRQLAHLHQELQPQVLLELEQAQQQRVLELELPQPELEQAPQQQALEPEPEQRVLEQEPQQQALVGEPPQLELEQAQQQLLLEARSNQLQLPTRLDRDFQELERLPGWIFRYSASTERLLQFPLQSDSHYLHH